jgi:hypothetical protein
MKKLLIKGIVIAGIAVGIAALGVAAQRMLNSFSSTDEDEPPVQEKDTEEDLEVVLQNNLDKNAEDEDDESQEDD